MLRVQPLVDVMFKPQKVPAVGDQVIYLQHTLIDLPTICIWHEASVGATDCEHIFSWQQGPIP